MIPVDRPKPTIVLSDDDEDFIIAISSRKNSKSFQSSSYKDSKSVKTKQIHTIHSDDDIIFIKEENSNSKSINENKNSVKMPKQNENTSDNNVLNTSNSSIKYWDEEIEEIVLDSPVKMNLSDSKTSPSGKKSHSNFQVRPTSFSCITEVKTEITTSVSKKRSRPQKRLFSEKKARYSEVSRVVTKTIDKTLNDDFTTSDDDLPSYELSSKKNRTMSDETIINDNNNDMPLDLSMKTVVKKEICVDDLNVSCSNYKELRTSSECVTKRSLSSKNESETPSKLLEFGNLKIASGKTPDVYKVCNVTSVVKKSLSEDGRSNNCKIEPKEKQQSTIKIQVDKNIENDLQVSEILLLYENIYNTYLNSSNDRGADEICIDISCPYQIENLNEMKKALFNHFDANMNSNSFFFFAEALKFAYNVFKSVNATANYAKNVSFTIYEINSLFHRFFDLEALQIPLNKKNVQFSSSGEVEDVLENFQSLIRLINYKDIKKDEIKSKKFFENWMKTINTLEKCFDELLANPANKKQSLLKLKVVFEYYCILANARFEYISREKKIMIYKRERSDALNFWKFTLLRAPDEFRPSDKQNYLKWFEILRKLLQLE